MPTRLLASREAEDLLLGPEGSTCLLTLAGPRFASLDGTAVVELVRHPLESDQALL